MSTAPWVFWKDHEDEFPALASLARDVLSIPATGAGVERLFNSARDVCHYRRGSLNASTIQELMMFMCATKFEVEEAQLAYLWEYLTQQEREAAEEEKDVQQTRDSIDPISDNEEDSSPANVQLMAPSKRALGKWRKSHDSEPEGEVDHELDHDDDDGDHPLPTMPQRESTQIWSSGRNRKKPRREDDGFEYY